VSLYVPAPRLVKLELIFHPSNLPDFQPLAYPTVLLRIVRLTLAPAHVADFLTLFRASESQIRQQPGCRHLELWQDADDPHIYCTYSHWDDAAALNAYRHSALFGQVWPATKRLLAAPAQAFSVVRAAGDQ
jgi:quinol monooxygenase YgiN